MRNPRIALDDVRRAVRLEDSAPVEGLAEDMATLDDHVGEATIHLPALTDPVETDGELLISNGDSTRRWVPRISCVPLFLPEAAIVWAAMPAALTEFLGLAAHQVRLHLATYANMRFSAVVTVAGSAGSELRIQYSADGAAWVYPNAASSSPAINIDSTGVKLSAWVSIDAASRGEGYLRLVGYNGNGIASPAFGSVMLQMR